MTTALFVTVCVVVTGSAIADLQHGMYALFTYM